MNNTIIIKNYPAPAVSEKEILHYAKSGHDPLIQEQIGSLLKECLPLLYYKVAYCRLPISIKEDQVDLTFEKVTSYDLAKNLSNCKEAILFAATIGLQADRLIAKYSRLSPAKALLMQAIGTERIESLCEQFSMDLQKDGLHLRPRFSPGYGDLPLTLQKKIMLRLDCAKNIGVTLNSQLLMTPSKSVTAIIGLEEG